MGKFILKHKIFNLWNYGGKSRREANIKFLTYLHTHLLHIRGFDKSVQSLRDGITSRLFLVSGNSWRITHQISVRQIYYSMFGVHLNRSSIVICEKMNEKEFCVMIKHYFLRGKMAQESKAKFDKYDESVPGLSSFALVSWVV